MKRLVRAILLILAVGLLWSQPAVAHAAPRLAPQIRPEMELLAGVLTQTTWIDRHGPQSEGNEYYRALRDFFSDYQSHEAIKLAQELTNLGYTYDAPIAFICHLGPLPDLELQHEYSEYIVGRAHGRERLERFRSALKDLAAESNFMEFYRSWQPRYQQWVEAANMDGEMVVNWLEQFFGQEASEFQIILAPAMFPGGGYGATVTTAEGEKISFQVVRERGESTAEPSFPSGLGLEYLSLHEWGHSFVNPALEARSDLVGRLVRFFRPVSREMKAQAYGSVHVFMNEQVLRAVTTLAAEELYGQERYEQFLANEMDASFYLTEGIVNILRDYQNNRDTYPNFDAFVPVLLERIGELAPGPWWKGLGLYWQVAAIVVGIILLRWSMARRGQQRHRS
ncbi:MAG: DUF4932 domain-containing protein [Bacillota bacterium]|jgi:hypothetical protein